MFTINPESAEAFSLVGLPERTGNGNIFVTIDGAGNQIPSTVKDAKKLVDWTKWKEAWELELQSLVKNRVGSLVSIPKKKRVLKSRVIFKIKYKNGKLERYKARFVACGYAQRFGVDYDETFSPVAQLPTVRVLIALCCQLGLQLFHLDFETAFLQSDLKEEIYIALPEGADQFDADGNWAGLSRAEGGRCPHRPKFPMPLSQRATSPIFSI